ncbi:MAG: DNA-directed RNA polymerase subunit A'', partial [Candidatus Methanofastidiosia archaeon]
TLKTVSKSTNMDVGTMKFVVELDPTELEEYDLTIEDVLKKFKKDKKLKGLTVKDDTISFQFGNISLKKLREYSQKIIKKQLGGVKKIERAVIRKENDEYVIYTEGSKFGEVLKIPEVDFRRSYTNDIREIYSVLGIEAARNSIIREIQKTLNEQGLEVEVRHIMLLADLMAIDGELKSIGRHGISGQKLSILAKAAFEVTTKHLFQASKEGSVDNLNGVTENVIIGQPIPLGTGIVELEMKEEK